MAETSAFWTTNGTGDGPSDGYTATDFYDFVRRLLITDQEASQGVLKGVLNELAVSGSSSPLSVASGSAIAYGFFYQNSASLNLTVTTPTTGTTGGRVNLKVDWTAQTVRAVVQLNTDGTVDIPALTQIAGSEWNLPLATFTITMAGVITLTDVRSYCQFANYLTAASLENVTGLSVIGRASNTIGQSAAITADTDGEVLVRNSNTVEFGQAPTAGIANNAVTDAKLRQSTGLSVIGRSANTTGNVADITAGSDGDILRRSGTSIGFGTIAAAGIASSAISTAKIANDAVTIDKIGNQVPGISGRQGGSSTNWATSGTSNYTPGAVRMQGGAITVAVSDGNAYGAATVTFPAAFSYTPLIVVAINNDVSDRQLVAVTYSISASGFSVRVIRSVTTGTTNYVVSWIAIGPE